MLWSSSGLGRHAGRRAASRDDGSGRARRESSPKTASRIEGAAARGRYASRTSRPCARRSASVSTTSSWSSQLDSQTTQRKAETKQRQPHGRPSLSARALGFGLGLGWPWFSMRRLTTLINAFDESTNKGPVKYWCARAARRQGQQGRYERSL